MTRPNHKQGPLLEAPFDKYKIEKSDGSPVSPEAVYFVLRLDTDINARSALMSYAACVSEINPELASGLISKINYLNQTKPLTSDRRISK